jgi:hypothetical protein
MNRSAAITAAIYLTVAGALNADPLPRGGLGDDFYPEQESLSSAVTCGGRVLAVRRIATASRELGVKYRVSVTLDEKELDGAAITQVKNDLERNLWQLTVSSSCYLGADKVRIDRVTLFFGYRWEEGRKKSGETVLYQDDIHQVCGRTKLEIDASNPASARHSRHEFPAATVVRGLDTKTQLAPRVTYCDSSLM